MSDLDLGDGVGVDNLGVYQQLDIVHQQLVEMNNQMARINARAALTEAREFNHKITSQLRNVVDYQPIPKTFPGHPFAALKASRQSPLPTVRAIQWFYNDPNLGPILNDDATRDDCREFLDTLKDYIKL